MPANSKTLPWDKIGLEINKSKTCISIGFNFGCSSTGEVPGEMDIAFEKSTFAISNSDLLDILRSEGENSALDEKVLHCTRGSCGKSSAI